MTSCMSPNAVVCFQRQWIRFESVPKPLCLDIRKRSVERESGNTKNHLFMQQDVPKLKQQASGTNSERLLTKDKAQK